ncbi:flagellar basal body L-ring protein FlgH [Burkholderiaceae bacterium UC74_6]
MQYRNEMNSLTSFVLSATSAAMLLCGCAGPAPTVVPGPVLATPVKPPMYLERPNNGAIYQAWMQPNALFSAERRPQAVGDTMKVDIAENLKASHEQSTNTSRQNSLTVKGPGSGGKSGGVLNSILNADASASGSDSYKGNGTMDASTSFTSQIAVTVINVLPNGNLVVAGERNIGLNGGRNTLRFSGTLDPRDIRPGNVIDSKDVVNASFESVAQGDVNDASSRTWLQRVLARTLSVW